MTMNPLSLALPPWVRWAVLGIAAIALFSAGWTVNGWRHAAHEKHALEQQAKAFNKQQAIAQSEGTEYEQGKAERDAHARTRETQVRTIYRTVTVPGACEPPADALGVLDNAIAEGNSRTAESGAAVPRHT